MKNAQFDDIYSFDLTIPKAFNIKNIENFLTHEVVEMDGELVDAGIDKPADKGKDLYLSKHTTLCEYCVIDNKVIFNANVDASLNAEVYYPQVCIDLTYGNIVSTICTCEASPTGTCTHVSCLLHVILDVKKQKEPQIERPGTSKVIFLIYSAEVIANFYLAYLIKNFLKIYWSKSEGAKRDVSNIYGLNLNSIEIDE